MRLPYVDNPPNFENEADQAIVQRVQERRGGRGLIPLDLTLLHSPPVADGWNTFLGSIRNRTNISTSIRETAICRIAALNKAWFEWDAHAPLLRHAGVVSEEGIKYILESPAGVDANEAGPFDREHAAVLMYTDQMTKDIRVLDTVMEQLRKLFTDREVVEITATVAAYNCVSRFLVALDVGE
ncbi:hypothetical protein M501DRAFT_921023, partial [Patellaria atrata CBS 101060]